MMNDRLKNRLAILMMLLFPGWLHCIGQNMAKRPSQTPDQYKDLKQVIIVYKTHFDIGYSQMARDVVHGYRTEMMDRALEAVKLNSTRPDEEQFVWTVPGWPMEQMLWSGQDPERKKAMEKAIREGNLVVHAMPFTTHTETLEPEDLVRGLGYSSQIARTFDLELPRAAKMTDVPCHSWILPTILHHAGVEFLHIGAGLVNKVPIVPMIFWWEGPDRSRLLTMYVNSYGTDKLPAENWPYKTWIFIHMTGDNQGPPGPETVQKDIAFYRDKVPGVKVKIGQLSDFSDALLAEKPDLPVVRGDMPDSWVHGVMSSPAGTKLARNIRLSIATTEALNTLEKSWGIFVPDPETTLRKAYEQSLLFGEHTWGLAGQHYRKFPYGKPWEEMLAQGLPPHFRILEESWDEHDNYIKTAASLVLNPLASEISALSDNVKVEGHRIVVYNPLPWKRDGMVTVNVCYFPEFSTVKPTDGDPVPLAKYGPASEWDEYNVIRFLAKDIPPMGYRTFIPVKEPVAASGDLIADESLGLIESPFFKAQFDPDSGRITSLVDKRTGRELVDDSAPQGFGQYLYERFGKAEVMRYLDDYMKPGYPLHPFVFDKKDVPDDAVYQSALPENMTFHIDRTPVEVSAVMTGTLPGPGMPQSVSIRLTLYHDTPAADLEVGIEKKPDGWPEAGWICLPFLIEDPSFRLGRIGSIINPVTDIINGSNFRHLWINTGAVVFNGEGGVGLCPMDSPMVSLGEPGSRKYDVRYIADKAYVYLNLYNNQWQTNFREWWGGRLTSRVRIWTFDKYDPEHSLYTPSMEARVPLLASKSMSNPGKLPATQAGLQLSRRGIAVTAFGPNPDGEGTILRLWENTGTGGPCEVTLPVGMNVESVQPVDLRGRPDGTPIQVKEGSFTIALPGYAPATFLIQDNLP